MAEYLSGESEKHMQVILDVDDYSLGATAEGITQLFIKAFTYNYVIKQGSSTVWTSDNEGRPHKKTVFKIRQELISCICLTCGIRNDHSNPTGCCQNGHDDWLEYRDVMLIEGAETFSLNRACKLTGLSRKEFRVIFLDNTIKQIAFKHQPNFKR